MSIQLVFLAFLFTTGTTPALPRSETVSWSIGNATSKVDGVTHGPVTFIWTFNKPVQYGAYLDGTPFVVWEDGLQLVSVSPNKRITNLPFDEKTSGNAVLTNGVADATCISPGQIRLPLDQRMGNVDGKGTPWGGGADVWNEQPTTLQPGDCIVTGHSNFGYRDYLRRMLFNAIGVCNVVSRDMTGRYRPPMHMPRDLRAALLTPTEVSVDSLPSFNISQPKNWSGSSVTMNLSGAVGAGDADDLLNGPIANCGLDSYVWYEPGNGMLNHNLSGADNVGYQRNVSDRFATCLYTAFDPAVNLEKRQRSLNKFIQIGLDYYYMSCLGYPVWNGGGGHVNGLEGAIALAGALLGDAAMTDAIKYQRFKGDAIGRPGVVYDMLSGYQGTFSRNEALYMVSPAVWQSSNFVQRTIGSGTTNLADCIIRMDMARSDMVINNQNIPFTAITTSGSNSAISVSTNFVWPMYSRNVSSEASRSFRYPLGGVMRLNGDSKIRKIVGFKTLAGADWTESTWSSAGGRGGQLVVYPALTAGELSAMGQTGLLTTGICTKQESENDEIVLWESWPADNDLRVQKSFFASPTQDYLDNKLGDHFYWLPYYHLLNDPGAPGKKLYEESPTYKQVKRFVQMQRNQGSYIWSAFASGTSLPNTPTMQALVRYYLLDDTMPSVFCKAYVPTDKMWTDP